MIAQILAERRMAMEKKEMLQVCTAVPVLGFVVVVATTIILGAGLPAIIVGMVVSAISFRALYEVVKC